MPGRKLSHSHLILVVSVTGVILLGLATLVYLINAGVVLYRSAETDPLSGAPKLVILNPVRDRAPEVSAALLVRALQDGHCRDKLAPWFRDYRQKYAQFICDSEQQHPLVSWSLFDRDDRPPLVVLHYRGKRRSAASSNGYEREEFSVTTQFRDGTWQVTRYEAMY